MANLTFIGLQGASPPRELQLLDLEIVLTEEPKPLLDVDGITVIVQIIRDIRHHFLGEKAEVIFGAETVSEILFIYLILHFRKAVRFPAF